MEVEENIQPDEPTQHYGKRVYIYFAALLCVVLVTLLVKGKWQAHVLVHQITVEGINIISKDEVIQLMKIPSNVSMYDLDLTILQQNILANSFVKRAVVKRDSPSMLRVEIEERKPAAILGGNELHYIDDEGVLLPYLSTTETYDIPVISGIDSASNFQAGQKIMNTDVQEALEIIRSSRTIGENLFHSISEIRLHREHDILLYSFETGVPIIFGKGDVTKKMVKLDAFWQKFLQNSDTKEIQYIDIRFDDQVVVSRKTTS
ncbi:MAG: FtsQ-type POTRA domain-containing protein [Bacteroidota bacterium]|nr:FtsQ-type POTRA domain-containing protein [Bacteroidota bacterium]